jgi:hypothetical protein
MTSAKIIAFVQARQVVIETILILSALALGYGRLHGDRSELFQAIAHVYVGGLVVGGGFVSVLYSRYLLLALAIALSMLETICAFAGVGR